MSGEGALGGRQRRSQPRPRLAPPFAPGGSGSGRSNRGTRRRRTVIPGQHRQQRRPPPPRRSRVLSSPAALRWALSPTPHHRPDGHPSLAPAAALTRPASLPPGPGAARGLRSSRSPGGVRRSGCCRRQGEPGRRNRGASAASWATDRSNLHHLEFNKLFSTMSNKK